MLQTCSMGLMKMSSAGGTKLWREDPRDWIGQESSMWKEQSSTLRRAIFKPQPQFDASAAISSHDSVNIRPTFCGHRISICTTLSQSPILEVLRCHHQLPTKPPLKLRSYERPCHSKPSEEVASAKPLPLAMQGVLVVLVVMSVCSSFIAVAWLG